MVADVLVLNTINIKSGSKHEWDDVRALMSSLNGLKPPFGEGKAQAWDEKAARKTFMDTWKSFDASKIQEVLKDPSLPRSFEAAKEEVQAPKKEEPKKEEPPKKAPKEEPKKEVKPEPKVKETKVEKSAEKKEEKQDEPK